jgi:hypothetical protein
VVPIDILTKDEQMALTGKLIRAEMTVSINGTIELTAVVELHDSELGAVGAIKTVTVDTPEVVANVRAYVDTMLPSLALKAGVPVSWPEAPAPVVEG